MAKFDFENRARPVLKWAGGKSGILPQLIPLFPEKFDRYIEPFMGGGAVFFSLSKNTPAVVNDYNPELVNLYAVVRNSPHDLRSQLDALSKKYSEDFYYELRSILPSSPIERAARTVFLNKTGFNGLYRQNSKGVFNVPFGKRVCCPALYEKENLLGVSARLQDATILNVDFEEILAQAREGDFVYCDPPYEPLSQTSSFNAYNGGGFSQEEQRRLRNACEQASKRGVFVAISNSTAPLILDIYKEFDIRRVLAKRAINSKGGSRGEIEEVLVRLPGNVCTVPFVSLPGQKSLKVSKKHGLSSKKTSAASESWDT